MNTIECSLFSVLLPSEDTVRRLQSASRKKLSPETGSSFQNCEEINFYYLSHSVCEILLPQLELTHTHSMGEALKTVPAT